MLYGVWWSNGHPSSLLHTHNRSALVTLGIVCALPPEGAALLTHFPENHVAITAKQTGTGSDTTSTAHADASIFFMVEFSLEYG